MPQTTMEALEELHENWKEFKRVLVEEFKAVFRIKPNKK